MKKNRIEDIFVKRPEPIKWHKRCQIEEYEYPIIKRISGYCIAIIIITLITLVCKSIWRYFNG
jgi:hypothetical protein